MTLSENVGSRKVNSGFALITVLVIMLVAILLGVSASQLSVVDERVSGNYRAATMARFAAEYGAAKRFSDFVALGDDATFKDKVEDKGAGLPACNGVTFDGSGIAIPEGSLTGVSGLEYDYYECQHQAWNNDFSAIEDYYAVKLVGVVNDDAQVVATDEIINLYRHEYGAPFDGSPGILGCEVSNTGKGQSVVVGSVHANCPDGLSIKLGKDADPELYTLTQGFQVPVPPVSDVVNDSGEVLVEGFLTKFKDAYGVDANGDGVVDVNDINMPFGNYPEGFDSDLFDPVSNAVTDSDLVYENISSPGGLGYVTCTLDGSTPTGFRSNDGSITPYTMYYCPGGGQMTVLGFNGNLSYVTMVSEGDIDINGAGALLNDGSGTDVVGMSVIAGGKIEINGKQDSYGLYWADGDVTQNGRFFLNGSVISSGNVQLNGNIDFDGGNPIGNGDLSIYKKVKLFSWSS